MVFQLGECEALEIKTVAVIGAGIMGHGIAQIFAQKGYRVKLSARRESSLENALANISESLHRFARKGKLEEEPKEILGRIYPKQELKEAVKEADFVIEAIPEISFLKKQLFRRIVGYCRKDVVITTNTSSIGITELAYSLKNPQNFCGMHFFNPAQIMKLVEVIKGKETSEETVNKISMLAIQLGKKPLVENEYSIVNQVMFPALDVAISLYFETYDEEKIDNALITALNLKMGYLRMADFIGLDTVLFIMRNLESRTNTKYGSIVYLERMVEEGMLGKKSGSGFYEW